jgi:hypothetical protein
MATVKKLAIYVAIGLALRILLGWAGFSEKQAWVLFVVIIFIIAFGINFVLDYHKTLEAAQHQQSFLPYSVLVQPNWSNLLLDYKLVKDAGEFQQLWEKSLKLAPIQFAVLRPWLDVKRPGLIYWDSGERFVTNANFYERIEGVEFEIPLLEAFGSKWSPGVYFEFSGVGYEMGLDVKEDWWEQICAAGDVGELCKTKTDTDPRTGMTRLAVATLPDLEFGDYHEFERGNKRRQERDQLRDKQLSLNGWKREERDPESMFIWQKVEHKYFTIMHTSI